MQRTKESRKRLASEDVDQLWTTCEDTSENLTPDVDRDNRLELETYSTARYFTNAKRSLVLERFMLQSLAFTRAGLMDYYLRLPKTNNDRSLVLALLQLPGIDKVIEQTKDKCRIMARAIPILTIMFTCAPWHNDNYLSVADSVALLYEWCAWNSIDKKLLINCLRLVIKERGGKVNSFYVEGPPNSGKTLLFQTPFKSAIPYWSQPMQINSTSQFVFCEIPNSRIICIDEAACDPSHLETLKLLMAGEPADVNVKHNTAVRVSRTPVIITTNNPPWFYKIQEEAAFRARMFGFNCKHWPRLSQTDVKNKQIHPRMWYNLLQ